MTQATEPEHVADNVRFWTNRAKQVQKLRRETGDVKRYGALAVEAYAMAHYYRKNNSSKVPVLLRGKQHEIDFEKDPCDTGTES